jgi:DNA-binding transcriptional MerR regulator
VEKAQDAFRTISEVAAELEIPQHVLRFWESRFHEIRPMKRGGGRRFYRPQDVDLLRGIRHLLYGEGYTIRGVQRILREHGQRIVQNVWRPGAPQPARKPTDGAPDDAADEPAANAEGHERAQAEEVGSAPEHAHAPLAAPAAEANRDLPRQHARKLQMVLDNLVECRRLIERALGEAA